MGKRRERRSVAAARGTARDSGRGAAGSGPAESGADAPERLGGGDRLTSRIFTVAEVVLVIVPLAMVSYLWIAGGGSLEGLQGAMQADPAIAVEFIAAMGQAFVAWLLRFVHAHYRDGDAGYAAGNLIALICGELMLQNAVGVIGCAILLWRIWRTSHGELGLWARERGVGGVLVDLSGPIVVCLLGAICLFAYWRISLL